MSYFQVAKFSTCFLLQEKINKMKSQQAKLELEKKKLKEALEVSEQRATKLELTRRALEGDLQRNQIALNEKEANNQVLIICKI